MDDTVARATARQRALAEPGDHHLVLCLSESPEFDLPSGPQRFLCESRIGHAPPCGARLETGTLRWNERTGP